MAPTREQIEAVQRTLTNNPSMVWNGKFGFYSNGQIIIDIWWSFDEPKEIFKITYNKDGSID